MLFRLIPAVKGCHANESVFCDNLVTHLFFRNLK